MSEDFKYREAFQYIVGYIVTANKFGLPVNAKDLFEGVSKNYGIDVPKEIALNLNEKVDIEAFNNS